MDIIHANDLPEGEKPLSRALEDALLELAAKHAPNYLEVCPTKRAPRSLKGLIMELTDYIEPDSEQELDSIGGTLRDGKISVKGVRVPVPPRTGRGIWSSPEAAMVIEGLVRSYHVSLNAEMDREGILKVYGSLMIFFPEGPERTLLRAFLVAPYVYEEAHGVKPRLRNQRSFVRDCMVFGIEEVLELGLHH